MAIQNGTSTLFRGDQVPIHSVLCNPDVSSRQFPRTSPWMPLIILDLFSFSRLLNKVERRQSPKFNPLDYTETLLSLLYRLVEASALGETSTKSGGLYGNVLYLVMLAFMMTLLPEYTRDGSVCPLLSGHLESAIQDLGVAASEFSDSDPPLLLWILFVSGISVLNFKDHHWLSPLIAGTCERLELYNWVTIEQQLSQFPWIFALHEAPGRRLWEDVRLKSRNISWHVSLRES